MFDIRKTLSRLSRVSRTRFEDDLLFDNDEAARTYLEEEGVLPLLLSGSAQEIPPVVRDLALLHRVVERKKPKVVLEFGIGFSTVVIAHALSARQKGSTTELPKLVCVDTSPEWIENARKKIPENLLPLVEIVHSDAEVLEINGQFCHAFKELPNIRPDLIYLDGPDPRAVQGTLRGLSFTMDDGTTRPPISADMLFYESTLRRGSIVVIDGRFSNVWFLKTISDGSGALKSIERTQSASWNCSNNRVAP